MARNTGRGVRCGAPAANDSAAGLGIRVDRLERLVGQRRHLRHDQHGHLGKSSRNAGLFSDKTDGKAEKCAPFVDALNRFQKSLAVQINFRRCTPQDRDWGVRALKGSDYFAQAVEIRTGRGKTLEAARILLKLGRARCKAVHTRYGRVPDGGVHALGGAGAGGNLAQVETEVQGHQRVGRGERTKQSVRKTGTGERHRIHGFGRSGGTVGSSTGGHFSKLDEGLPVDARASLAGLDGRIRQGNLGREATQVAAGVIGQPGEIIRDQFLVPSLPIVLIRRLRVVPEDLNLVQRAQAGPPGAVDRPPVSFIFQRHRLLKPLPHLLRFPVECRGRRQTDAVNGGMPLQKRRHGVEVPLAECARFTGSAD